MRSRLLSFLIIIISLAACKQAANNGHPDKLDKINPVVSPKAILKDLTTVSYYNRDYLKLAEDFYGYDSDGKKISKEEFLKLLAIGTYLPLKLATVDSSLSYILYPLPEITDPSVSWTFSQLGKEYYGNFKKEGRHFPITDFVDVNGKVYDTLATRNKILVFKYWFIRCGACIAEMPKLNQLVKEYNNRNDVLFLSFAFDPKEDLINFLKKTTFNYEVIPVSRKYIDDLNIEAFPTHMIINKNGMIAKVVNSEEELSVALQNESKQKGSGTLK